MFRRVPAAVVLALVFVTMLSPEVGAHPLPMWEEEFSDSALPNWTCTHPSRRSWDGGDGWTGASMKISVGAVGWVADNHCERTASGSIQTYPGFQFAWKAGESADASTYAHIDMWYLNAGHTEFWMQQGTPFLKLFHAGFQQQANFFTPAGLPWSYTPLTWYRTELTHDAATGYLHGKIYDASNNLVAATSTVSPPSYPSGETTYERVVLAASATWGIGNYWYDSIYLAGAGAPARPENVTAQPGPAAGQITVSWAAPRAGATPTAYHIYRGTAADAGTFLSTVYPSAPLSYTDTNLADGSTWHYKVIADSGAGDGPSSRTVNATVWSRPGAPTGLTATQGNNVGEIRLQWTAPPNGGAAITAYRVHRGTAPGAETYLTQVPASTTWTDQYLTNGTRYYYRVSAVNAVGEGPLSTPADQLPKPDTVTAPSSLAASPNRFWTGDPTTVSFSYSATVSQCPPTQTCPVTNEWRIYLDGNPPTGGTLLASGTNTHAGHGGTETYAVSRVVNPTGADGSHTIWALVNTRSGSTWWQLADVPVIIDAPLPGQIASFTQPSLDKTTIWPGDSLRIQSAYSVFQKQCKSTSTCPVTNEWRVELDGTLLTSGSNQHPAHGETQTYTIDNTTWSTQTLSPGTHTVSVSVRHSPTAGWETKTVSFTVRPPSVTLAGPNAIANPPITLNGRVDVSFNYTVVSQRCVNFACNTTSEWRILVNGGDQNGRLNGTPQGDLRHQGTHDHPGQGQARLYSESRLVVVDNLVPGIHKVTVAVRAIANNNSHAWHAHTVDVRVLSSGSADGDSFPDSLESELCGNATIRDMIQSTSGAAGRCPTNNNYVLPPYRATLTIPRLAVGPDGDKDGFPGGVEVVFYNVTIYADNATQPEITPTSSRAFVPIDPDDANANRPLLQSICVPVPQPGGLAIGPDLDGDGVPGVAQIPLNQVCVNRNAPPFPQSAPAALGILDPDDNDPTVWGGDQVTASRLPVGLEYIGRDEDKDGVLIAQTVTYMDVTFTRANPDPVTTHTYRTTVVLDMDDRNPNLPSASTLDSDGDGIRDLAEAYLCGRNDPNTWLDGECQGSDYLAPSAYRRYLGAS